MVNPAVYYHHIATIVFLLLFLFSLIGATLFNAEFAPRLVRRGSVP
jgi:hypothetical protein